MPAIWTDVDGQVQRIYNDETELTDEEIVDAILVDSIPNPSAADYESAVLYYSDTEGLYFQYEDRLGTLSSTVSETDKSALCNAIDECDHKAICEIFNFYL
jgi:hypothetical protein